MVPDAGVYWKVPATEASQRTAAGPSGLPAAMGPGVGQVIVGVAFSTLMTVVVVRLCVVGRIRGCEGDGEGLARSRMEDRPRGGTVCERARHGRRGIELCRARAVPNVMSAGLDQVRTGVAFRTFTVVVDITLL